MVMRLLIIKMLEVFVLFAERGFADNPGFQKLPQASINGRPRGLASVFLAGFNEVLSGEMAVEIEGLPKNFLAAQAQLKAGSFQMNFKAPFFP